MDRQNDKFKFGVSSYSERGNTELKDEDVQIVMAIKVEIVIIPPPYVLRVYVFSRIWLLLASHNCTALYHMRQHHCM